MFKVKDTSIKILSGQMCIDLVDLKSKIESPEICAHSSMVCNLLDELCAYVGHRSADEVNEYCYPLIGDMEHQHEIAIDALRMAFFRYLSGGLHDLYIYQENEGWFPRIKLTEVLTPNDIGSLDKHFFIYRGCDISEYRDTSFGQSWSTCEDTARKFAFGHYDSQDWFDLSKRAVIWAICSKEDVLYSDQTEYGEYEVVVKIGTPTYAELFEQGA